MIFDFMNGGLSYDTAANTVKTAIATLEAGRARNDELESVWQQYSIAGEALSCIIELVMPGLAPCAKKPSK